MKEKLELDIHPRKQYLQSYRCGVEFLGVLIKPWRNYVTSRIKNNSYLLVKKTNLELQNSQLTLNQKTRIVSKMNSYIGILNNAKKNKLKKKLMSMLNSQFSVNFIINKKGFVNIKSNR